MIKHRTCLTSPTLLTPEENQANIELARFCAREGGFKSLFRENSDFLNSRVAHCSIANTACRENSQTEGGKTAYVQMQV
jgi:hypothetical protein